MKRVIVSGGFDPIHIGHTRMIREALKIAPHVIVVLNNDNWLKKKKGFVFMPEHERKEILESISGVSEVIITNHVPNSNDPSVCESLKEIRKRYPTDELIFANGGDRKADNIPEYTLCPTLQIVMIFGIGEGGKVQSSSDLVRRAEENKKK